ncbi:MAG: vWA domain-containing protein, partial [Planctomycetota bacterium]|nr:vWA domain-containing protein [Planctomycetota bacterium]
MIRSIKRWWQVNSGKQETPFDGDAPFWVVSLLFHLGLLLALTFVVLPSNHLMKDLLIFSDPEEEAEDDLSVAEEFHFSEEFKDEIGARSENGEDMALSQDIVVAQDSIVKMPLETVESENAEFMQNDVFDDPKAFELENVPVKGFVGESSTGAEGAIDRITQEILLQIQERKTLVVWVFDQSASLIEQRAAIKERIARVYEELGVIEASGDEAFQKEQPLLTAVYSFGNKVNPLLNPTDSKAEITESIDKVERDDTGIERVFTAIYTIVKRFEGYRKIRSTTKQPERNVMIVVITDEAGDDVDGLDATIKVCRAKKIPVYVIGVPAPFGRKETPVKWVDPDPKYDQTPQWTTVNQGPESLMPERIKLYFAGEREDAIPVDSGFGPFGLTRVCYETGGIYFAVHPNRNFDGRLKRRQVDAYTSHLTHFFDSSVMRKYKPDYTSLEVYWKQVNGNATRRALVQAAQASWISQMKEPQLRFDQKDEAGFVNAINLAQRTA